MGRFRALGIVLVFIVGLFLPVDQAAAAQGSSAPGLNRPIERSTTVLFTGRAQPSALVRLQIRGTTRWATVSVKRAARSGAYRIATAYPSRRRAYRVVSGGRASVVRRADPRPAPVVMPVVPAPTDACGARPKRGDGTYYACSFHDDFDGTDLDTTKWMAQDTRYSGMYSGHGGCYVDNERTIAVASGMLRLTSTMLDEPFLCESPLGSFMTTSEVSTVATTTHFSQAYGRFEARLRFPTESGIPGSHAAFWLYPQAPTYGEWPGSGEVDVAEWFSGLPANVYPSVHYKGENPVSSSGYTCAMPTASTAFHNYAVEWTPDLMKFYYDGKFCFSHAWTPTGLTGAQPFDQPFYLVLTQAWGSVWNAPTDAMPSTSTLVVDWVRAWQ